MAGLFLDVCSGNLWGVAGWQVYRASFSVLVNVIGFLASFCVCRFFNVSHEY